MSIQKDMENGCMDTADQKLREMGNDNLTLMFRAVLNWRRYRLCGGESFLKESDKNLTSIVYNNKKDIQFQNYKAVIRFYLGEREAAICQLENLVSRFPHNTSYHLNLANMYYLDGKWKSAVSHYAEAIMLSPSILESEVWCQFAVHNEGLVSKINACVEKFISSKPKNPILLAKYGKIWYIWNNDVYAKNFLQQAITLLPNLEMPWFYLLEIAKHEGNKDEIEVYQQKIQLWRSKGDYHKQSLVLDDSRENFMPYWQSIHWLKCAIWYRVPISQDFFDFYLMMPKVDSVRIKNI